MTTTPSMNMTLPDVQLTLGPQWASELNAALEVVDQHDHTSGSGNPVPTAGIQLNADLTFNGFAATELDRIELNDQIAALTEERSVYSVNGDLYYTNTAGDQVQITAGNSIAGTPGAITGLGDGGSSGVYYDATETLAFFYSGTAQAKFDISTIQLHPFDIGVPHPEYIALIAPTSLASSYDITLPGSAPTQTNVVSMGTDGVLTTGLAAGSAAAPSMAFAADLDTGIYSSGTNVLAFATNGVRQGFFNTSGLNLVSGSQGAPSYTFDGDSDTGIYRSSANTLAFTTGGTIRGYFTSRGLSLYAGTAASPSLSFDGDDNTGIYQVGADQVGVAAGGSLRLGISSSAATTTVPVLAPAGSASAPSFAISGDSNTGIYSTSADRLMISTGGTRRMIVDDTGVYYTNNGTEVGGSGIKWRVFTGSLAASGTTTLANPGTTLISVSGVSTTNGGSAQSIVMAYDGVGSTSGPIRFNGGTGGDVDLFNLDSNSTNTYTVLMFYQ